MGRRGAGNNERRGFHLEGRAPQENRPEEIQAPATVWAYNGRGCVLNIFFYPHVDGGEYRALTYDVKSAEQAPESSQRCFDELLQDLKKAEVN